MSSRVQMRYDRAGDGLAGAHEPDPGPAVRRRAGAPGGPRRRDPRRVRAAATGSAQRRGPGLLLGDPGPGRAGGGRGLPRIPRERGAGTRPQLAHRLRVARPPARPRAGPHGRVRSHPIGETPMNEQRKDILDMLAEGKITADEAEQLIAALERDQPPAAASIDARPKGKAK